MFANGSLGVHHIGGCCSARTSWFPCVLLCVVRDLKQDVKRLRAERDEAQGALDKLCREVQEGKPPRLLPGNLPPYAHLHRAVGPGPYPRAHRHMGQPPPPPKSAAEFGRPRRFVGFLNFADLFCRFFGFL